MFLKEFLAESQMRIVAKMATAKRDISIAKTVTCPTPINFSMENITNQFIALFKNLKRPLEIKILTLLRFRFFKN